MPAGPINATPTQFVPYVRGMKQEQMEAILDRFDAREEFFEGHEIVAQGDMVGEGDPLERARRVTVC